MIFTRISSIYQVSASYASHRANDQNIQKNDTAKIMLRSWVPIFDTYYLLLLSVIVCGNISQQVLMLLATHVVPLLPFINFLHPSF